MSKVSCFAILLILVGFIGTFAYFQLVREGEHGSAITPQNNAPLEITVVRPEREVRNPFTEVTLITNKPVSLEQHNRLSLTELGKLDEKHYYVVKVSNLGIGEGTVTMVVVDEVGNKKEQILKITRLNFSPPPGFTEVAPWPDATYTLDGDSYEAVVDKQNRLLEDYIPDDLVDLNKEFGIFTLNNASLRREAASALNDMLIEMRKQTGKFVTVASGYRSYETQVQTYSSWVKQLGEKRANEVSARPGHSEHQLGTTIDFVNEETNWQITDNFGSTDAGKWLSANSEKFGFIQPYKKDNTAEGGYKEESWHFRYMGSDLL